MKVYGEWRYSPILNLNTLWRWVIGSTQRSLYPLRKRAYYPVSTRLDGLQKWSGQYADEESLLPLPRIEPQFLGWSYRPLYQKDLYAVVLASLLVALLVCPGRLRPRIRSCETVQAAGSRPSASAEGSRSRSQRHSFRGETLTDLHLPTERPHYVYHQPFPLQVVRHSWELPSWRVCVFGIREQSRAPQVHLTQ
jgi:hypothetical protein